MITAFLEFDHRRAIETSLPTFLLSYLDELFRLLVFRTRLSSVPFSITQAAYFRLTATAFTIFPATSGTTRSVDVNISWPYPFSTTSGWTIDSVFGSVFLVFFVPLYLECISEEFVYVLQGDVVLRTAFGWHVLGVGDGHGKYPFETLVAHAVTAA